MRAGRTDPPDPIIERLQSVVRRSPSMGKTAQRYRAVLPLLRDADLQVGTVALMPEQVSARMKAGLPLLRDLDLELDIGAAHDLALRLILALEAVAEKERPRRFRLPGMRKPVGEKGREQRIRTALEEGRLDVGTLLEPVMSGQKVRFAAQVEALDLDPDLLWTLMQHVLRPALRTWQLQLAPLAERSLWQREYCYVCGCRATLGELREDNQTKHLRCGQCGADWPVRRLFCARCGNEDHRTLGYLCSEGDGQRMRVEVCEKCRGYIKVIASFAPTAPEMLEVEDLATLHLDYIAQERGYSRDTAVEATTSSVRP